MPTGPTAHVAPGFPLIVAAIVKIFGPGLHAQRALFLLAVLVQAFSIAMLPFVASALGFDFYTGVLTGCFALIAQRQTEPLWDMHYAVVLAGLLTALTVPMLQRKTSRRREILMGCLWGVLILFTPSVLPVFVTWLAWRYFRADRKHLHLSAALALLIVAPAILRNFVQFGRFVFVRDNLGLELHVSNNP